MKRRKVVGLALFTATLVYLVASFLALYQNQRVKLEKGIEEAMKLYSQEEKSEVKELNKNMDLLLNEKADISDLEEQRINYEGSFARMEKNVTNVTNEITSVENYVANIIDKITQMQSQIHNTSDKISEMQNQIVSITNENKALLEQIVHIENKYTIIENLQKDVTQNKEQIVVMEEAIDHIYEKILLLESSMSEKDMIQDGNLEELKNEFIKYKEIIEEMKENSLFYQYDEETQTLHLYGDKEKVPSESESEEGISNGLY